MSCGRGGIQCSALSASGIIPGKRLVRRSSGVRVYRSTSGFPFNLKGRFLQAVSVGQLECNVNANYLDEERDTGPIYELLRSLQYARIILIGFIPG